MKKISPLFLCLAFIFLFAPAFARAEEIKSFDVVTSINKDASVTIIESITYDFGQGLSHGIFREIPVEYSARGGNFSVRISDIAVKDEKGQNVQFVQSSVEKNLRLRIGDPNSTFSGQKTYVIQYKIAKAINYFSDHDEFYWNVTGNGWPVGIGSASASVIFPEKIAADKIEIACFAGALGLKDSCKVAQKNKGDNIDGARFAQSAMTSGQGLTFVVSLPKGIMAEPSKRDKIIEIVKDNWIVLLPLLVLIVMTILWYKKGRDPEGRGTIVAQFDVPDDLTPTEVGIIVDENLDKRDMSAEIIGLAVRGFLKIERTTKKELIGSSVDYVLTKTGNLSELKNDFEIKLMEGIFVDGDVVAMSSLDKKFYKTYQNVTSKAYDAVTQKGYFLKNPNKTRLVFYAISGFMIVAGIVLVVSANLQLAGVSVGLSGLIVVIFGKFMPVRTIKGVGALEYILGLKTYLNVAEKDRLDFHNAPEKNPQRFEKLLPFAMALGVEKAWAKQFEGIYSEPPSWYSDPAGGNFNSLLLVHSLGNFSTQTNSALTSQPAGAAGGGSGFGGSGFSGGGFGGGGGGSW